MFEGTTPPARAGRWWRGRMAHGMLRRIPALRAVAPLVCLTGLAWATGGAAQEVRDRPLATVRGTVVDAVTGEPLAGVVVVVAGADVRLESDDSGRFTITRIPVGAYQLELTHPGYRTFVDDFTVLGSGEFATGMEPIEYLQDGLMTGITGVVRDAVDGRAVAGATVWTAAAPQATQTDGRGRFTFTRLYPGRHLVEFSHLGYATRADSIDVEYGRMSNIRVSFSADPVRLDPIEVSVERRDIVLEQAGFYEREAMGFGKFLDRDDIEKRPPGKMSDLFSGLAGVTLVAGPTGQRNVILNAGRYRHPPCFPRVVLDDMIVGGGSGLPAELDVLLMRSALAGVEVYTRTAAIPMKYGGTGSSCGVIVIWTRR
ncbi:MAG: carboxypeptidase regulatory-like domain-containing protein [Gemmatimonadetes bacterium]|nr:carboxypeptidase regulatory-like domain-containing protein [Gemmatimonadota bacterium]MCY3677278.1 carboxypeptidase regulatory-like domain-containing protein [Gemmatimonadota bacterium]